MKLYISSIEYKDFSFPNEIISFEKIKLSKRNVLKAHIEIPLIGQKYGLLGFNVTTLYLVNRFDELAFEKLNQFPIDVHIFIIKDIKAISPKSLDDLQNIAWGCLYNNKKDASYYK